MMWWARSRLHVSWQIAWACGAVVAGVVCSNGIVQYDVTSIAWLLTGTALLLTAFFGQRVVYVPLAIVGGLLIGLWRGELALIDQSQLKQYEGKTVTITGTVLEDTDTNKRGQAVLRLKAIHLDEKPVNGSVWVTVRNSNNIQRSDTVTVRGRLDEGFGSFAASMSGANIALVTKTSANDIALGVRDRFAEGVSNAIQEPSASLGLGYVVGQRRGLPEELDISLQAAGLTHIVVASGYNLTILVRIARRLFERISKYLSFLASTAMIVGFVGITGLSPSMSRAGLITGLSLVAWYYGRSFHPMFLLPFAMAITVLVQPNYGWGDLGWQLSFAAFAGVMLVAPLLQAYLFGDIPEKPLVRILVETISATIATLPIIILSFGQFSIVAPVANMLILPLVPLAMLLTFVAGLAGMIMPALAPLIGLPGEGVLFYMVHAATFMGNIPWAVQEAELSVAGVTFAYGGIMAVCVYMKHATRYDFRSKSLVE